mgnify:CR=1 FL=1
MDEVSVEGIINALCVWLTNMETLRLKELECDMRRIKECTAETQKQLTILNDGKEK